MAAGLAAEDSVAAGSAAVGLGEVGSVVVELAGG